LIFQTAVFAQMHMVGPAMNQQPPAVNQAQVGGVHSDEHAVDFTQKRCATSTDCQKRLFGRFLNLCDCSGIFINELGVIFVLNPCQVIGFWQRCFKVLCMSISCCAVASTMLNVFFGLIQLSCQKSLQA